MFLHLYKYKVIILLHLKDLLWWNILFPIALTTLFYCGFSNLMDGKDNKFEPIDIAVVTTNENKQFTEILDELSKDGDDQMFNTKYTSKENALELLNDKDIKAIIYVDEAPSMEIIENGINQTIIQKFLNNYLAKQDIIKNILQTHPEKINSVIEELSENTTYGEDVSVGKAKYDPYLQYFFALIAMACLYGTTAGSDCVSKMQANMSSLGMRREASPQHKLTAIISDFLATVTVQFISILLLLIYLIYILKIDMGASPVLLIITALMGTTTGVSFGVFISSVCKANENVKTAICMTFSMVSSFLSGLMVENIKDVIEKNCAIINRINPAALISDALYALNMYSSYSRFIMDMVILLVMNIVLILVSYINIRRCKYASL